MKPFSHLARLCIGAFLLLTPLTAQANDELATLRKQYAEAVLRQPVEDDSLLKDFVTLVEPETSISDQNVQELMRRYAPKADKVIAYLRKMRPDGSWTDINYADQRRSAWAPRGHAERALELARLYCSDTSPFYRSDSILHAYRMAINFWAKAKIKCKNWWYNQIGMPKTLGDSYVLMYPYLTPADIEGAVSVLGEARISGTGQNKVWLSGVVLVRALLQNDTALARQARGAILEQVRLGQGEGVQPDWSFHQHGPQQQFGNYGLSFMCDMSFYSRVFRGTSFALTNGQTRILENLMQHGYRWIIWHRYMDVNAVDRQLYHNAQVDKAYSIAFAAQNLGLEGFPLTGNALVGHKHFDCSDYTLHRRPAWMASLKMASNRVIGTEKVNEDNLLGFYLADGATYFYTHGNEYNNIFPLWNWRAIPGTTASGLDRGRMPQDGTDDARNHTDLVGGLTLGEGGMSAMELNKRGVHARKAWLFTGRYVLCLGGAIKADTAGTLLTTCMDQRLAAGPLKRWSLEEKKWKDISSLRTREKTPRFYHDGTGYIALQTASQLEAVQEDRTGDWRNHMGSYEPYAAQGRVTQLTLLHDVGGSEGSYLYMVMPCSDSSEVARLKIEKEITVYQNNERAQMLSVRSMPSLVWLTAYEAGVYKAGRVQVEVAEPGIYVYRKAGRRLLQLVKAAPFRLTASATVSAEK